MHLKVLHNLAMATVLTLHPGVTARSLATGMMKVKSWKANSRKFKSSLQAGGCSPRLFFILMPVIELPEL
jgi:hypothetical protein